MNLKPDTYCGLCLAAAKLERSHIVPQFVYRWLRDSSATGYLRFGPTINPLVKGAPTRTLLCARCEDRFSVWESQFARDIFHPYVGGRERPVTYGIWLLKFAVSICWRILEDARRVNRMVHGHSSKAAELDFCLRTWRDFLLGKRADVGEQSLHLCKWNGVADFEEAAYPGNMNRYLRRTIEVDVFVSDDDAFVYAKLGPVLLFGLIRGPGSAPWRESRIHREGKLKIREVVIPFPYRDYIARRAIRLGELEKCLSEPQRQKIPADSVSRWMLASDVFTASEMDQRRFKDGTFAHLSS